MTVGSPTLADVIARYVGTLKPDERASQQLELTKFMRWFGPEKPLEAVDARSLENYQEQVAYSGADQTKRLEPVRGLLTYAQKQGLIGTNLAKFLKLKRSASRRDLHGGMFEQEVTQLTREGHAKLTAELDRLVNDERPKVAQELWEARQDKDIRENAPYDAAKQHQALVEARIRELQRLLATSSIIESNDTSGRITVGSTVVLRDMNHDEELTYTLVGPQEANPRGGKISIASPVGKALLEKSETDIIEVEAPMGTVQYRVERIER